MTHATAVPTADLVRRSIDTIRTLAIDGVERARSGHPGTPMGLAPLAYTLWTRVMAYAPSDPAWPDRDRFVLSAGHASMLLYASLHLVGYDLPLEELKAFRQWGSKTPGHPEHGHTAGVETTTGPLGQGVGNAVGLALAERMLAARYNRPGHEIVDHRTWAIAGDGDLMEGVASEAASLAGHLGLSKLCVFYDDNRITIDGTTAVSFTEDVGRRFEAYGWAVQRVADGAGPDELAEAAERARRETTRPSLVIVRTHIGFGSPGKQDSPKAHGEPLGAEEVRKTKRAYGWPEDAEFLVPDDVARHFRAAGQAGEARARAWRARWSAYAAAHPGAARQLEAALAGAVPAEALAALDAVGTEGRPLSTRKASGQAIQAVAAHAPAVVGGSADLAASNLTKIVDGGEVQRGAFEGRNLAFGVREHAMGAILNGLALHGGLRPFGGTFLVFSDYMRPSVRLAALMRLPVLYVFTHDSIGLGEDGPTHQPVEHLAALRAIPGLTVLRPADAAETAEAWRFALEHPGPVALALSRQDLPALGVARVAVREGLHRGAYVVQEPAGVPPQVVLLATGSEVSLCVAAARRLEEQGVPARVVSAPALERLGLLSPQARAELLPPRVPRVAVEAGVAQGWHRWVGEEGAIVSMDRFGASAPGPRLFTEFGFTPERVATIALGVVRGTPGGPR